ncbi:MAG: hypothetical protein RL681_558 [Candidatus Parcubacteria bacterium]|jgi:hypothetical protein
MLCATAPSFKTFAQVLESLENHQKVHYSDPDVRGTVHCRRCQEIAQPVTITLRVVSPESPHKDVRTERRVVSCCVCEASSGPPDIITCFG